MAKVCSVYGLVMLSPLIVIQDICRIRVKQISHVILFGIMSEYKFIPEFPGAFPGVITGSAKFYATMDETSLSV